MHLCFLPSTPCYYRKKKQFLVCCHLSPQLVKEELIQKNQIIFIFVYLILGLESMFSKCLLNK